jgi:DNA-binding NtrC family response regulator
MTQHFRDCICEEVVNIPPLRETVTDIVPMATFFLEHFDERRRLSSKAKHKLEAYPWPGNVRELVRVIELAVKKYDCDKLQPEHLTFSLQEAPEIPTTMKLNDESEEKAKIVKALESCHVLSYFQCFDLDLFFTFRLFIWRQYPIVFLYPSPDGDT